MSRLQDLLQEKHLFRGNIRWQRWILAAFLYLIILTIISLTIAPVSINLEPGRPSPHDVKVEQDTIDLYTTNLLRDEAAQAVPESFEYDPTVLMRAEDSVVAFFSKVREIHEEELELDEKIEKLTGSVEIELNDSLASVIIQTRPQDLNEIEYQLKEVLGMILQQGVKAGGLETARRQVVQEINFLLLPQEQKRVMDKVAQHVLEPNMIFNPTATALAREAARLSVEPVRIMKGAVIIREGDTVTEQHMKQLEVLGLLRSSVDYTMFFGLALLLLVIFIVVGFNLFIFQPEIYQNITKLLLLGLIVLITLVFIIAATYFSGYLVPVAMGVMLITILLNPRLAMLMTVVLAVLVALVTGNDLRFMLVALFGGLVAVYSVSHFHRRSDLTRAGFYVAAVNLLTIIGLFLVAGTLRLEYEFLREFSIGILAGITNGVFSAVMTIGLLPYLESGFGLTTSVTLLELANPNHPLLKRLLMEAPGTYHHSLVVANLAEAAAEATGADPLLTRVGAFYHDIGKLKRPYFFIENQLGENPHEKISPNLSTLIITSHIKDGCELAQKAKLPQVIRDIICQHHGNSLVSYFYHQAAEKEKQSCGNGVCEESFRYDAPLPQSKEAAIILLADAVEAAARAMPKPVGGRIEGVVRKIVKDKLADGQFDQCDLTLKELDVISATFVRILSGIYHNRIEYPERELKAEIERGPKNDSDFKQTTGPFGAPAGH
jgi:putative nucleotidyltransferase with HDIG domain